MNTILLFSIIIPYPRGTVYYQLILLWVHKVCTCKIFVEKKNYIKGRRIMQFIKCTKTGNYKMILCVFMNFYREFVSNRFQIL